MKSRKSTNQNFTERFNSYQVDLSQSTLEKVVKAQLVARSFEENHLGDFIEKKTWQHIGKITWDRLTILASRYWRIKSMDVKSAFSQSKEIKREHW